VQRGIISAKAFPAACARIGASEHRLERNPPPKTKLRINYEDSLLTVQRRHDLRTRALLLVLRSPARAARSRPSHNRVPLSGMSDDETEPASDSRQRDQRARECPDVVGEPRPRSIILGLSVIREHLCRHRRARWPVMFGCSCSKMIAISWTAA
jgi:hypothetical protein